jgi:8-oxo-dGTP diphosphatase
MEKERPKIGVNIFVVREGKILLGKRKNVSGDGHWGLPGGHFEMFESLIECGKRELKEETGLTVDSLTFLHLVNDPLSEKGTHYIHINFLADNTRGEPRLMEPEKCSEWRWFDLNSLPPKEEMFVGHQKLIPAFVNKIIFKD